MPNQSDPNNPQPVIPQVDPTTPVVDSTVPVIPPENSSPVQQPTDAPVVFPTDDVAPMPDFMNQGSPDSPVPPISPILDSSSQIPASDGSAAPADFPSMVSAPKKKFGGGKLIATILGILVLIGGIGTGVYLTRQQQQLNSEAAKGQKSAYDLKREREEITKLEKKVEEAAANPNFETSQAAQQKLKEAQAVLEATKKAQGGETLNFNSSAECGKNGGIWCGGCGGYCSDGSQTCEASQLAKCNEYPTRGSTVVSTGAACIKNIPVGGTICSCADNNNTLINVCFSNTGTCGTSGDGNGLCAVWKQTGYTSAGAATGSALTYYCPEEFIGQAGGGGSCLTPAPAGFNKSCYCGTIQVDVPGQGFKSESMKCGCVTSTTTTTTSITPPTTTAITPPTTSDSAVCQNVKAYSSTWVALTSAQLSTLAPATVINFCVVGSATAGIFDRAQFTINGVAQAETTTQRPSTQDYCQNYTIPAGVSAFNVTAKIHHTTLGWK